MKHERVVLSQVFTCGACLSALVGARRRDPLHFLDETTLLSVAVVRLSTVGPDSDNDGREQVAGRVRAKAAWRSLPQSLQFSSTSSPHLVSVIEHAIRLANERSDNDDATTVAIGEDACALIRGRRSPSAALPGALRT